MERIPKALLLSLLSAAILLRVDAQAQAQAVSSSNSVTPDTGSQDPNKGFANAVGGHNNPSGTSLPPDVIQRVNNGVSTILRGVWRASLQDILRGSFMFTRNENVRSVANNVIDQVFQPFNEFAKRAGAASAAGGGGVNSGAGFPSQSSGSGSGSAFPSQSPLPQERRSP